MSKRSNYCPGFDSGLSFSAVAGTISKRNGVRQGSVMPVLDGKMLSDAKKRNHGHDQKRNSTNQAAPQAVSREMGTHKITS